MDTNFYHTRNYVYFGDPEDYKYNYCVCAEKTELQAQKTAELLNQCFEFIQKVKTRREITLGREENRSFTVIFWFNE